MRRRPHIKVFRPIRPGARRGHGHKRIRRRGREIGLLASLGVPLLMNLVNKL